MTPADRRDWNDRGWIHCVDVVGPAQLDVLRRSVDQLDAWATTGGPGLHHFESTERGPVVARSEHFADVHRDLGEFVRGAQVADVLAELFGEPAVLFKEKVNYKHPGGGGFAPHQDATAYRFVDHHISVMVPLDPATIASGCLFFAPGHLGGAMPTDDRGRVDEPFAATLDWQPVEAQPGDMVFFDSYAPHHSGTNRTDRPRRALYLTYNAASKGDHRAAYYADKTAEFARADGTFDGARVRISVNDDFLGRPVTS